MSYQIESGLCHGRGFSGSDPDGFLAKFVTWVVKTPAAGGPGWFIIDDQSALGTDPYIVISDVASPAVNDYNTGQSGGAPKYVRLLLPTSSPGRIDLIGYLWWDSVSHTGQSVWFHYYIATGDDVDFVYDFRGGDECIGIASRIGTDWDHFFYDDWEGDTSLVEGPDKVGVLQSGVTNGTSVVLQLDTGEASNFTQDNYYYIIDLDGHIWGNYVKVTNVNLGLDQITVDEISFDFPSGAVISSYPIRHYAVGTWHIAGTAQNAFPMVSAKVGSDSPIALTGESDWLWQAMQADFLFQAIDRGAPNDDGDFVIQKPIVVEYRSQNSQSIDANRTYGSTKNTYLVKIGTMAQMQDGRIIGGDNWIFASRSDFLFNGASADLGVLIPDTESL